MALYRRNKIYWIDINHNGERIQRSTGTSDKIAAQEFHDNLKARLWRQSKLGEKPKRTWMEAAVRWINESSHKRSLKDDIYHLRWLDSHLRKLPLDAIDRSLIEKKHYSEQALKIFVGMIYVTLGQVGMFKMERVYMNYNSLGLGRILIWFYVTRIFRVVT